MRPLVFSTVPFCEGGRRRAEKAFSAKALLEASKLGKLGPAVEGNGLPAGGREWPQVTDQAGHDVGRMPAGVAADEQIAAATLDQ